jgi:hypothetical protein
VAGGLRERKYSYFGASRASKLGEVLFITELARRIKTRA